MFFELVSRNSKRNRKENSLFFASLLITTIALYLILSLRNQDVMKFLATMESDAVNRLLCMIPLFYGVTLFILFFLIYYASKYQLESRKHEFGMYLMMGMKRNKLFRLLLAEDIRGSMIALIIGIPIGIAASELISLVTARFVGLGIIGHTFSFSLDAILGTALGIFLIKFVAFLILSGKIVHQEIGALLTPMAAGTKKHLPFFCYMGAFIVGVFLLGAAYTLAIKGLAWSDVRNMAVTFICGLSGTLLLFFGLRSLINIIAKKSGKNHTLHTFTFRQLEEEVIQKSNVMAICSLLILAALTCFGSGIAIAVYYSETEQHTLDYTFALESNTEDVEQTLEKNNLTELFDAVFDMEVGRINVADSHENAYSMESVLDAISRLPDSGDKDILQNNMWYVENPYLISLSGYNKLLSLAGLPELVLGDREAAVYMDNEFAPPDRAAMLNEIIATKPEVKVNSETYQLTGKIQSTNLVVDRSITLSFALIFPDDEFQRLTGGKYNIYKNAVLCQKITSEKSLLTAVAEVNKLLDNTGIHYESYLQNIGRRLFYVVAASYITIYLAIVFLIIANTIIGIQFLTQQQRTRNRYQTLIRIGAPYSAICYTAKKQINLFFGIPVILAAVSSIFGVRALLSGFLSSYTDVGLLYMMGISGAMILLLCVVEYFYMTAVKRISNKYLLSLMTFKREE